MKKTAKKLAAASALLLTGMHGFNKYIDYKLAPVTPDKNNLNFTWKDMDIKYSVKGAPENPPLLLIHNLHPASSKEEWYRIDDMLAEHFHIYELDLPGCGKSDKPDITYINYMYVQLIGQFIKTVIGKKTSVCAAAFSSSFTLMTARMDPELIDKIIIINPTPIKDLVSPITKTTRFFKKLLETPIIGTFLYNCKMSKTRIAEEYKYTNFYSYKHIPEKILNVAYYNAHCRRSSGKYLLGGILGRYTNINIIHALPKIQNDIYFIGSSSYKSTIQEYKQHNPNIHAAYISNCRLLPHLETPKAVTEKILHIMNAA